MWFIVLVYLFVLTSGDNNIRPLLGSDVSFYLSTAKDFNLTFSGINCKPTNLSCFDEQCLICQGYNEDDFFSIYIDGVEPAVNLSFQNPWKLSSVYTFDYYTYRVFMSKITNGVNSSYVLNTVVTPYTVKNRCALWVNYHHLLTMT